MKKLTFICLPILLVCSAVAAWGQGDFVGQPTSENALSTLPAALTQLLDPHGTSIKDEVNGVPTVMCEVWWVKSLTTQANSAKSRDVLYGSLRPGSLIGVLHFPAQGEDAGDQKLRPGFYTMRYAQLRESEDTDEISHFRDFVLVSPVLEDKQVDQVLSPDELQKLSRMASRTSKPAIFPFVPSNPAYKKLPAVLTDGVGNCIMQVSLPGKGADGSQSQPVEFALILLTPEKESGVS